MGKIEVYYFTPFSLEKRFFNAIDKCMSIIEDDAWAVIQDGDTAFLRSDFGVVIHEYIKKYPDTGLFTCYASRCHYEIQRVAGYEMDNDSILVAKTYADMLHGKYRGQVEDINRHVAGHLMVISKKTWLLIRKKVALKCANKFILGVDTKISKTILTKGLKIRLMKSIMIFHYLRMAEGFDSTKHLN